MEFGFPPIADARPNSPRCTDSEDTKLSFLRQELHQEETEVYASVQAEAVKLVQERGEFASQAAPFGCMTNLLRDWLRAIATDEVLRHFLGHGQIKPEQLEIEQLKQEVTWLNAERDISKKAAAYFAKESKIKGPP